MCFILDLAHWSTVCLGREFKGLYLLEESISISSSYFSIAGFVNNIVVQTKIWHSRLGHLSNAKLALMRDNNVLLFNNDKVFHCEICPLAKQKRLPFTSSSHISNECFDLIHCDSWGPFFVSTFDGCRFFLTIVDDCSRCIWVYLLKHKSQTQFALEQFCTMVKTQFSKKGKNH